MTKEDFETHIDQIRAGSPTEAMISHRAIRQELERVHLNYDRLSARIFLDADTISWLQAVLNALNCGNVDRDSPLHLQVRRVMIGYREALEKLEPVPAETTSK